MLIIIKNSFSLQKKRQPIKELTSGLGQNSAKLPLFILKQILKSWFKEPSHSLFFPPQQTKTVSETESSQLTRDLSVISSVFPHFLLQLLPQLWKRQRAIEKHKKSQCDVSKGQTFTCGGKRCCPVIIMSFLFEVSELVLQIGNGNNCEWQW